MDSWCFGGAVELDEEFLQSISEAQLDANRSVVIEGEQYFVPKKIPKMTSAEKWQLIKENGGQLETREASQASRNNKNRRIRVEKVRRALAKADEDNTDGRPTNKVMEKQKPWRRQPSRKKGNKWPKVLIASDPHQCPKKFDAVTEGLNKRIYVFAGEYVYQTWMENGLQQRSSFLIPNLFPDGPRQVSAAFTNRWSGVTMLLAYKTVYRYRWNKKHKRFYLARNSPQVLSSKVDFLPTLAFQWKDGHLILANADYFVTYNPFRNLVMFKGKLKDHFPNLPRDAIGLTYGVSATGNKAGREATNFTTFLLMTAHHGLQIYDLKKYKIVQEYPIEVKEYVACLAAHNTTLKDNKKAENKKKYP